MTARRWTTVPHPDEREPRAAYIDAAGGRAAYERAQAVYVCGARFARQDSCDIELVDEGAPCSTYRCTACGKLHVATRSQPYCPRCGARNLHPDEHDRASAHKPAGAKDARKSGEEPRKGKKGR